MKNIIISTKSGNIIAEGIVGENVLELEGNYYFDKAAVKLDQMLKQEAAYTCPIKKSTCDYYFVKNETGGKADRESAWIYEDVTNTLFKGIQGKVGFYSRSTNEVDLEILE
jgi:uncharacterized protein (DUF427 family)